MLRALKYFSLILLFSVMILIGVAITLIRNIDPNQYKNELSTMFTQLFEQPVEIQGELAWALYPRVSLSAQDIHIKSQEKPNPLDLKSVLINLRLLPLLSGNLEIISITLRDLNLNVLVDKQGRCNWNIVQQGQQRQQLQKSSSKETEPHSRKHHLMIEDITISNANVDYQNQQTGQHFQAQKIRYQGNVHIGRQSQKTLENLRFDGRLSVGDTWLNQLHINSMTAMFKGRNGVFDLSPINASLYEGRSLSHCQFDFRPAHPTMKLTENFSGINMNQVFADLGYQKRLHGTLKGDLSLTASNLMQLPQSLSGKASVEFNDGRLKGVDILQIIEVANAVFNRRQPPRLDANGETPFKSLTGDIIVTHGDLINENFKLISPVLTVTGNGHIDLNHWNLEYRLNATAVGVKEHTKMYQAQRALGGGFPLIAKGRLDNYQVTPDMQTIIKQAAKHFLKHEVGDKVDDLLKKSGDKIKKAIDKDKPVKELLNDLFR